MPVVQVRGTSGSGKSWVMKQIIKSLGKFKPRHDLFERKVPDLLTWGRKICIIGHYESECAGTDTFGKCSADRSAKALFPLIQRLQKEYKWVLCEGLLLSEDVRWTSLLNDARVIFLGTRIEDCIKNILKRRKASGNDKEFNESNTRNRLKVISRARIGLEQRGIKCYRRMSHQVPEIVLEWINAID